MNLKEYVKICSGKAETLARRAYADDDGWR